jgi:PhzF family phenazine biosynthesis protein
MKSRLFRQVDVFAGEAYFGNPLAVVMDGVGLSDAEMQRFARWTNLSETTFILPPDDEQADYRVRIFTPDAELPFAGHPTLGTCHAWLQAGGMPKRDDIIIQQCRSGLIPVRRAGALLEFAAPPLTCATVDPALLGQVVHALGLDTRHVLASQRLDNGPRWLGILVDDEQAVLTLEPDHARLRELEQNVGVVHVGAQAFLLAREEQANVVVRGFFAPLGVNEDPVTGSLNAALAQWLIGEGLAPRAYVVAQGERLGRRGRVHIRCDDAQQVWVGGVSISCIEGTVTL